MATVVHGGPRAWSGSRDDENQREYKIWHIVRGATTDGPKAVMATAGLPAISSFWNFNGDTDTAAFCWPTMRVSILDEKPGDPNKFWLVEQFFSTRPYCIDHVVENPLLTPDRVNGGFIRYTIEAVKDRFGALIDSSSHEMFRGPQVEFDESRPTVKVVQNRASADIALLPQFINTVNDRVLWGLGLRRIKLGNISWLTRYWGTCFKYYERELEFELNDKTFDRTILDEGTKVLNGHWSNDISTSECGDGTGTNNDALPGEGVGDWVLDNLPCGPPDPNNQQHFIRYKDRNGENTRVILNGAGVPANGNIPGAPLGPGQSPSDPSRDPTGPPGQHLIEYYPESNFLLLGIPAAF
jgi:hypothetical protein